MPTSEDEDIEWEVEAESPAGVGPSIVAPHDERARAILAGFKINWMNMSDAGTGEVLWRDDGWGDLMTQRDIHIPKSILKCRAVSREFQFSSIEMLQTLRLEQRIFFNGSCLEGAHPRAPHPAPHPFPSPTHSVRAQSGTSILGSSSPSRPTRGSRRSRPPTSPR